MLDHGLLQTGLLLAAPFLLPSAFKHIQSFLNPTPKGATTTQLRSTVERTERIKDGRNLAVFRLFVVTLGVSISLFTALLPPHNLFLSLSKPHSFLSRFFPILRYPLDIRLATETLHRAWVHQLSRPLTDTELLLIQRLQTLDARLGYIAYGSNPILSCTWCRPFSTGGGATGGDYLVSILPGVLIAYLAMLSGMGLLMSGNGREKWRVWAVGAVLVGLGNEVWKRLLWEGLRGGISQGQTVSMLHSRLHVQRSILAALLLLIAYFAPTSPIPASSSSQFSNRVSTSSIVTPAISGIVNQSEELLEKLRCLSIERMAILHHDSYRSKVNHFWETASKESKLARSDPTVQVLLDQSQGLEASKQFREFVERSFKVGRSGELGEGGSQGGNGDSDAEDEEGGIEPDGCETDHLKEKEEVRT
ncbi:hypothetical protein JCM5350_006151 [Sporobolomyces pararoseus]